MVKPNPPADEAAFLYLFFVYFFICFFCSMYGRYLLPADRAVSLVEAAALPVRLMSFPPCRETVFPFYYAFLCLYGMDFIVGGRGGTAEQTSFFMAVVFFQVCYFFSVFYRKVSSRFYGGHAFGRISAALMDMSLSDCMVRLPLAVTEEPISRAALSWR